MFRKTTELKNSGNTICRTSMLIVMIWATVLATVENAVADVTYSLDDGTAETSIILVAGSEARPTLWLNSFETTPGGEVITSISVTWGRTAGGPSGVPENAPTTVLLYQDDPSNDGDPRTATLLVSQVIENGAPLGSIDTGVFLEVPIPPTTVSGTFFVAALYPDPGEGFPAPLDMSTPTWPGRSWVFSNAENEVNINDLGDPWNFGGLIEDPPYNLSGNWLLRANGLEGGSGLTASGYTLSASEGGTIAFTLDAGAANAGRRYVILGSFSGSAPGFPLPNNGETLPINWDNFTDYVVSQLNGPVFSNFMAPLDGNGQGTAQLVAPPIGPNNIGRIMTYAYLLEPNPNWDFVSNPVQVFIVP